MDDARVVQVSLSHVLNQQAYILFYVRDNQTRNNQTVDVKVSKTFKQKRFKSVSKNELST